VKLATIVRAGREALALVGDAEVFDLTAAWRALPGEGGAPPTTVRDLLARDGALPRVAAGLDWARAAPRAHRLPLAGVTLRAPLAQPGKLICVASNYAAHIEESGRVAPPDRHQITPWLFLKPATTIIGPGAPIPVPRTGQAIDWEVELAAVIGRAGKHIPVADALHHVAGYTILNDISERRFKAPEGRPLREWDKFFDWLHGKWFDGFAPMGPWLVTADEIPDPQALDIELRVNGRVRQRGNTAQMIYPVAELIAFASSMMTLLPGDVVATGTPEGVGSATGEFLKPGDVVECVIERIGTLTNPVTAEDTGSSA
jgi:2-keto-4-pentenoate hydratase/2-oxohepta-3-ene-1,7-dioic acid hydratase in catechol pathway